MRQSRTSVALLDLGFPELCIAFMMRVAGQRVGYSRQKIGGRRLRLSLRKWAIEPIAIENSQRLNLAAPSGATAALAATRSLDKWNIECPDSLVGVDSVDRSFLKRAIRTALLGHLTARSVEVFAIQCWQRETDARRTIVIVRSAWSRVVFQDMDTRIMALRIPLAEALNCAWRFCAIPWLRGLERVKRTIHQSSFSTSEHQGSLNADNLSREPKVLLIFNRGLSYGSLYSYDYLFSEEANSPLYKGHVGVLTIHGGDFGTDIQAKRLPPRDEFFGMVRRWLPLYRDFRASRKAGCPQFVSLWVAGLLARAESLAYRLRKSYPQVSTAVFAYDLQVPPTLAISLHLAGIESFAVHERPASTFDMSSTLIVEKLLTASDFISSKARATPSVAVRETIAVGMWRTDLLHDARYDAPAEEFERARAGRLKLVLVLPYHLDHPGDQASQPVATSAQSLRHFFDELIQLSTRRQDAFFVIRGKNCDWLEDSRFQDLVERLSQIPNLSVSTNYSTPNLSYNLAAHASLVIAKPTSLADEVLALGIPCLLHDYTHNCEGFAVNNLAYLPRELWCLDSTEFTVKVDSILDKAEEFDEWWKPVKQVIYGGLSDGHVRARVRETIERRVLLGETR